MDFWRRSARISRKDKITNTNIKQKNECSKVGLFQTILKPNNFNGMDMFKEWKRGDY